MSADAKEIVAGCGSGQIMVYDIEAKRRTLSIAAHRDDGESVAGGCSSFEPKEAMRLMACYIT